MAVFCMRCGKEIAEGQVFCPDCLAQMALSPVKPGTAIQLPIRPVQDPPRKVLNRKKEVPLEKQLRRQRTFTSWLAGLLLVSWVLLGLVTALYWKEHTAETTPDQTIGQNYSAIETDDTP